MSKTDFLIVALLADDTGEPIRAIEEQWRTRLAEAQRDGHTHNLHEPEAHGVYHLNCTKCGVDRAREKARRILSYVEDSSR